MVRPMAEILIWSLLPVVLALFVLPIAVRVYLFADGQQHRVRIDGSLFMGLCGLSIGWRRQDWQLQAVLMRWLVPWPTLRWPSGRKPEEPQPQPQPRTSAPLSHRRGYVFWRSVAGRIRQFSRPALRLLRSMLKCISLRKLHITGRLGLSDAAATGMLYGWLQALRAIPWRSVRVEVQPCFHGVGFHGTLELVLHLYAGRLLWNLAQALVAVAWRGLRNRLRRR